MTRKLMYLALLGAALHYADVVPVGDMLAWGANSFGAAKDWTAHDYTAMGVLASAVVLAWRARPRIWPFRRQKRLAYISPIDNYRDLRLKSVYKAMAKIDRAMRRGRGFVKLRSTGRFFEAALRDACHNAFGQTVQVEAIREDCKDKLKIRWSHLTPSEQLAALREREDGCAEEAAPKHPF